MSEEVLYFCVECLVVYVGVFGWEVCVCDCGVFVLTEEDFKGLLFDV